VQLSGNPVWIKCTGGSAPAGSSNYTLLLKIISQDGKLDGAPYTDAIMPDNSGEALFNISGYVDQPIKTQFQYPASGAYVAYPTQAFNIQVQPGESWMDEEGVLQTQWGSISSVFQILKGGNNPRQLAMMDTAGTNFFETYLQNGLFLTPRPQGNFVHPTQPVKLWFMTPTAKSATYYVKGVYSDGSEDTYSTALSLSDDNLYEFNCNPADLGLTLEPTGKQMKYFDVWLESGGSAISDVRRFQFDWRPCERPFFVLFANSLGGIDDVYLSGHATEGTRTEGDTVYKPQRPGDTVYDRTLETSNKKGQFTLNINSGYKSSTEMLYLRDMLVSRQAWLLYPNKTVSSYQVVPVNIQNGEKELVDRQKNLWEMTVEMEEAHTSRFSFDNRIY